MAAFYRDVLGLPEVQRFLLSDARVRSVWLDLGGAILMVERTDEAPRHVTGVGAGPFLIALRAVPDLGEAERALVAAGVLVEGRTARTLYFRDPEGNRVALSDFPLGGLAG